MLRPLSQQAETNMHELQGKLPSGLGVGLSSVGLPMQVLWQPKEDTQGNTYTLEHANDVANRWRHNALLFSEARTLVHDQQGQLRYDFVNMGRVERRRMALHLATINFAGGTLLERLAATETNLSKRITYEESDTASMELGRYATGLINVPLEVGSSGEIGNAASVQLLARGPHTPPTDGKLRLAPSMRSASSLMVAEGLDLGVAVCLDEYTDAPMPVEYFLPLYEDAVTTAGMYKKWLGPNTDGAVKEIGSGFQKVVLFSDLD